VKTFIRALGWVLVGLAGIKLYNVAFSMISSKSDIMVVCGVLVLAGLIVIMGGVMVKQSKRFIKKWLVLPVLVLMFSGSMGCGFSVVSPGHVGIKVNQLGTHRGVSDLPLVTGFVLYNPITTTVFEWPTFVQTAVWTRNEEEGSPHNEEISFNSKEGLIITGDISLSYQLNPAKVPSFYVKFRSDNLDVFTHGFLRNVARDCFNEVAGRYVVEDIYGPKKEAMLDDVRARVNSQVNQFGVEIQQFGFIGAPRLPVNVVAALNAKIAATQNAIMVENQIRQAEASAKKEIAIANGKAKANLIVASSITPMLLELKAREIQSAMVEKWNGAPPFYFAMGNSGPLPIIPLPSGTADVPKGMKYPQ